MNFLVVLEQTTQQGSPLVCPGNPVTFQCTTSGDELVWIEYGEIYAFNSASQVNEHIMAMSFSFLLLNNVTFLSTATIPSASSADNNLQISCSDGVSILTQDVLINGTLYIDLSWHNVKYLRKLITFWMMYNGEAAGETCRFIPHAFLCSC